MARPGFGMLRACFFLLALVIGSQLTVTMVGSALCFFMFLSERAQIGACSGFLTQSREIWAEALAVVLALLLAARTEPPDPPPPPPPDEEPPDALHRP